MKMIAKLMPVLLVVAFLLLFSSIASARTPITSGIYQSNTSFSAIGGTTQATTTRIKSGKDAPVATSYTMPDVYYVGVDTPVWPGFRYNPKQKVNFGNHLKPKWRVMRKMYGRHSFLLKSLSLSRNQTTGSLDGDDTWKNPGLNLNSKQALNPRVKLPPGKLVKVPLLVNFDNCFSWPELKSQADIDYLAENAGVSSVPAGHPCVFGQSIVIHWEATIKGKKNGVSYSTSVEGSFTLYFIPLLLPVT